MLSLACGYSKCLLLTLLFVDWSSMKTFLLPSEPMKVVIDPWPKREEDPFLDGTVPSSNPMKPLSAIFSRRIWFSSETVKNVGFPSDLGWNAWEQVVRVWTPSQLPLIRTYALSFNWADACIGLTLFYIRVFRPCTSHLRRTWWFLLQVDSSYHAYWT